VSGQSAHVYYRHHLHTPFAANSGKATEWQGMVLCCVMPGQAHTKSIAFLHFYLYNIMYP